MRTNRIPLLALVSLLSACGDPAPGSDAGSTVDAPSSASCTVTASTTSRSGPVVVTGSGSVTCTGTADLQIETCLQWETGGTYENVQCQTQGSSGVTMLTRDVEVGCLSPRNFRTRVRANANGSDLPEQLSSVHAASCR